MEIEDKIYGKMRKLLPYILAIGTALALAGEAGGASKLENTVNSQSCQTQTSSTQSRYRVSQTGIDLVKKYEGFSEIPYRCPAGKLTIGYGHLIKLGENYKSIDRESAEKTLAEDLKIAQDTIDKNVKIKLTSAQYDALVSLVYNIGENNFRNSTLLKKLNSGDYTEVANQFGRWVKAGNKKLPGLVKRRAEERKLFLSTLEY